MNTKDIRTSSDPDLAGSYAAILRAARSAQDIAIQTNTAILVSIDGKDVCLTADEVIPPGINGVQKQNFLGKMNEEFHNEDQSIQRDANIGHFEAG